MVDNINIPILQVRKLKHRNTWQHMPIIKLKAAESHSNSMSEFKTQAHDPIIEELANK